MISSLALWASWSLAVWVPLRHGAEGAHISCTGPWLAFQGNNNVRSSAPAAKDSQVSWKNPLAEITKNQARGGSIWLLCVIFPSQLIAAPTNLTYRSDANVEIGKADKSFRDPCLNEMFIWLSEIKACRTVKIWNAKEYAFTFICYVLAAFHMLSAENAPHLMYPVHKTDICSLHLGAWNPAAFLRQRQKQPR